MKIISKILQLIEANGISVSEFERKSGLSNGYLANTIKRDADITGKILAKIEKTSPKMYEIVKEAQGQAVPTNQKEAENANQMDYKDKYIALLEQENKTKDEIIKANLTALVAGQSEATRYLIELSVGQVSTLVHLSVLMENVAISKHSTAERLNLDKQIAAKYMERTQTGNHEHKSGKA